MISQTGKLILYMCLYRNDYGSIKLSDKSLVTQNKYIKNLIRNNKTPQNILSDLTGINHFVINNWIKSEGNREYCSIKQISVAALRSFDFFRTINHDRVLPILYRWSRQNLRNQFDADEYSKIIELCASFSLLWRCSL